MSQCGAIGCNHNNLRETCSFFRLPANEKLRKKWLNLLRRDAASMPKVMYVCSCHFKDGKKENLPEIFSFNKDKKFLEHHLTPEKKKRKRPSHSVGLQDREHSSTISYFMGDESSKQMIHSVSEQPSTSSIIDEPCEQTTAVCKVDASTSPNIDVSKPTSMCTPASIEVENYFLKKEQEELKRSLSEKFQIETIENHNHLIILYTGLPDVKVFNALYELLCDLDINYYFKHNVQKISRKNQLLMTLMKLRQNFPHEDLACRFNVSSSTVSNVVITWVHILYEILYKQFMEKIPSRRKNKSCLPSSFNKFVNCRIILDCTEIYTMVPRKSMKNQKVAFSNYKQRNTFKALIGVAPNGVITFVSDLYPGSISDKLIVSKSKIIEQLEPGDLVIADKGFLIRDILPPEIHLNVPPFLVTTQFTKEQIQLTENIARTRIHVERAIRRIKCYKILNLIPSKLTKYADVIFKAVAALTNLHYPLIKEVENLYDRVDDLET